MLYYITLLSVLFLSALATPRPADLKDVRLDKNQHFNRIIGGSDATPGEYPWQTSLQVVDWWSATAYHICGGSIISEQWVVTAAHCVMDFHFTDILVSIGDHNLFTLDGHEAFYKLTQIIVHEGWNLQAVKDDIALLKLKTKLHWNQYISAIPLPPKGLKPLAGTLCVSTGWGDTSPSNPIGPEPIVPNTLQELTMPITDHTQCQQIYATVNNVTDKMICSGIAEGEKGVCQGDSGGPLVCKNNGKNYLAGIVSWGSLPCAVPNGPGVFTRVSAYTDWINNKIRTN